jgi:precorrin-3B C17-methyltransferase
MKGHLSIIGLGPGAASLTTPQAAAALAAASDLIGYKPYLERLELAAHQTSHASDNREELSRARHALTLAAEGRCVAVVSGGDAGVFGMASAVFEAIDAGDPAWRELDIEVLPGVSAMLAVAARVGAPLGQDFCVLSLSDNLKPWSVVTRRLAAAAQGGFVIALYNPASRARPWQLGAALDLLRQHLPAATPVVFASAVTRPDERIDVMALAEADATRADMRTLVLIGSAATRVIVRPNGACWVYSPRHMEALA